jgi:hypothetical protein
MSATHVNRPARPTLDPGSLTDLAVARASCASGDALKIIRQLGLSKRSVAEAIGIDPSAFGRWLRSTGATVPTGAGAVRFGALLRMWTRLLDAEKGDEADVS